MKSKYVRKALKFALEKDSLYLRSSIGYNKSTQIKDAVTVPKNFKNRKTNPACLFTMDSFQTTCGVTDSTTKKKCDCIYLLIKDL